MNAGDYFKIGCEILAGFAQSFWDSLNVFEQVVAVIAGVIGSALVLGCAGGFIAGKIGQRRRRKHADPVVAWPTTEALPMDPSRCPQLWNMVAAIEAGEYEIPQFAEEEE